jgi:hypothetical protein
LEVINIVLTIKKINKRRQVLVGVYPLPQVSNRLYSYFPFLHLSLSSLWYADALPILPNRGVGEWCAGDSNVSKKNCSVYLLLFHAFDEKKKQMP